MNILEAMEQRHSVREYTDAKIEGEVKQKLEQFILDCNDESGLNFKLITNEPKAFTGFKASYGKFKNVQNYIALIGKKSENLSEMCGFFGEKVALYAQMLGLNTCWVAGTYKKVNSAYNLQKGEKIVAVIAIGYGVNSGVLSKSRPLSEVVIKTQNMPEWFEKGVNYALLAPTALNQQRFMFDFTENEVKVTAGLGFFTNVDLGIVKYHFEVAAGKENFKFKVIEH